MKGFKCAQSMNLRGKVDLVKKAKGGQLKFAGFQVKFIVESELLNEVKVSLCQLLSYMGWENSEEFKSAALCKCTLSVSPIILY